MVCFRQHEDRPVSDKIISMRWNAFMDLIAIGLSSGDVCAHRLVNWQKIWVLSWPSNSKSTDEKNRLEINGIEWRPDGKMLAIGYNKNVKHLDSNNEQSSIALVDIENGDVIDVVVLNEVVTCLCWQVKMDFDANFDYDINPFNNFLEKLPPLSKSYSTGYSRKMGKNNVDDLLKVSSQNALNILAIGTKTGQIYFYSFGIFLVGLIDVKSKMSVDSISLSNNLGLVNVLLTKHSEASTSSQEPSLQKYFIHSYRLASFEKLGGQYYTISNLYCKIMSLLSYLNDSMQAIQETWEEILLEIDSKLSNFMSNKDKSSSNTTQLLSDEFLELLVIGNPTDSLEKFLHQLSEKGLKKLGQSIETTYASIQQLVVCNIQRSCKHIFSYLHVLKAIALWETEFNQIGYKVKDINLALQNVASFYLKSLELQQVIDSSVQNVKCFFKWLYTVIIRLYTDSFPPAQQEMVKLSQQDLQYVAAFIQENFESSDDCCRDESMLDETAQKDSRPTASNFTLEKVGQYLKPEPLVNRSSLSCNDFSQNPWIQYINSRPSLTAFVGQNDLILYKHNSETSLVQEHLSVISKIKDAFKNPLFKFIENNNHHPHPLLSYIISFTNTSPTKITHMSDLPNKWSFLAFIYDADSKNELTILRYNLSSHVLKLEIVFVAFKFNDEDNHEIQMKSLDVQFYNESTLTLLLSTPDGNSFLAQFPLRLVDSNYHFVSNHQNLSTVRSQAEPIYIQLNDNCDINYRKLDKFKPLALAVSGSRKVASIASSTRRRVRIFEMDVIDEDLDEDLESND